MSGATIVSLSFPPREYSQPIYKPTIDIYSLIHTSTDRTVRNQNSTTSPIKQDNTIDIVKAKPEMTIIVNNFVNIPTMLDQKLDDDDSCTAPRLGNEEEDDEDFADDDDDVDNTYCFEYSNEHDDIVFEDDTEDPQMPITARSIEDDDIDFEISFEDIGHEIEDDIIEIPEWFAHEDKDQLKEIFQMYIEALDLSQVKRVREPPKFVGRVKRSIVESDDGKFRTLDSVEVFRRSLLPPGSVMPHIKTYNVLTCWSFDEGLPIDIRRLTNSQKKYWFDRVVEEPPIPPSFLMCLPIFSTESDYDYSVSDRSVEVRHSPSSYPHHCYDEYIPKHPLNNRAKLLMSPTSSMFGEDNS